MNHESTSEHLGTIGYLFGCELTVVHKTYGAAATGTQDLPVVGRSVGMRNYIRNQDLYPSAELMTQLRRFAKSVESAGHRREQDRER
jgi:hypothetical protein